VQCVLQKKLKLPTEFYRRIYFCQ